MSQSNENSFQIQRLRSYSSVFSRIAFTELIKYGEKRHFHQIYQHYDSSDSCNEGTTLVSYLNHVYRALAKSYRCEYIYKNEIINSLLLKKYGTDKTIAFNEFKVKNSIVDIAMFNGESKAFEIKTELDTPHRLNGQICDYTRLFQKCYIVIPEEKLYNYINYIGPNVGIILLKYVKRHIELYEYREAVSNANIDPEMVMSCLRTEEYKNIVNTFYGAIPDVNDFQMYDICKQQISNIPASNLQELFLQEIEKRKNCSKLLNVVPNVVRQICLSMNLNKKTIDILIKKLNEPLI